jgi:DNA-binding MarR family transcriptional regulator
MKKTMTTSGTTSQTRVAPAVGVAFLLSQVGAHSAYLFEDRLAAMALRPQHAGLLRMLGSSPGLTQQALCDLFGIHPSRLVVLLDELEQRGLVERRNNPDDRRSYCVHPTRAGLKALAGIGALTQALEDDLCGVLSSTERDKLADVLRRIVAAQGIRWAVHPAYQRDAAAATARPAVPTKRARSR